MKIVLIALIGLAAVGQKQCGKKPASPPVTDNCYKGRLEVKGICSNYTISLLDGNIDVSKIESSWTDETTGKQYKNVFALGSPCTFPSTINAGDEFYFTLDTSVQKCAVCMAYYPHPSKALKIKVLTASCK